jgi:hypothetical protein
MIYGNKWLSGLIGKTFSVLGKGTSSLASRGFLSAAGEARALSAASKAERALQVMVPTVVGASEGALNGL